MAVTSIWSIKGWIGKVIKYAENPDKTKENNEGQISENQSQSTQGLEDVITYAVNTEKTRRGQSESMERELVGESEELMEQYVSGVNCAPTTAREEMIAVKKIRETGTEAAKTVKPILTASTRGIFALLITTAITDIIRKARGQGCGIKRLRIKVRIKIATIILLNEVT